MVAGLSLEAAPGRGQEESGPKPGALCPVKVNRGIPVSPAVIKAAFSEAWVCWAGETAEDCQRLCSGGALWTQPWGCEGSTTWTRGVRPLTTDPGWLDLSCQQGCPGARGAVGSCLPCASTLSLKRQAMAFPVGLMHGGGFAS